MDTSTIVKLVTVLVGAALVVVGALKGDANAGTLIGTGIALITGGATVHGMQMQRARRARKKIEAARGKLPPRP